MFLRCPSVCGEDLLQRPEELPHALESTIQFSFRSGIRNPNMFAGAESLTGNRRHVRFAQQSPRYVRSGFQPASSELRAIGALPNAV